MKAKREPAARSLTRAQSQEVTRSKLLKVARRHFLAKGIAGTVLDQVAAEAGFTRGALYANFDSKEALFLAVFDADLVTHMSTYREALDQPQRSVSERRKQFREAYVRHVTNTSWGILRTEFELAATRSAVFHKRFVQIHRRDLRNAMELAQKAANEGIIEFHMPLEDFVLAGQGFMMGMAIKQLLLSTDLPMHKARLIAGKFFDCFIASRGSSRASRTEDTGA